MDLEDEVELDQNWDKPLIYTAIDAFNIVKFNQFDGNDFSSLIEMSINQHKKKSRNEKYTVFLLASLINHSCISNSTILCIGDHIFIRASKNIS